MYKSGTVCTMCKSPAPRPKKNSVATVSVSTPIELVATDILGPSPAETTAYVLVIDGYFTK